MDPSDRGRWFDDHFEGAVVQISDFLEADGLALTGKRVLDIGCGDGIIDLGLALKTAPERLVGVDVNPVDLEHLLREASEHAGVAELPANLEFRRSDGLGLPAGDGEFDLAVSWSAFEHVRDPIALLCDVRRALKPGGVLMLQIWPLFHSRYGDHLWDWFPGGWVGLRHGDDEVGHALRPVDGDGGRAQYMLGEYRQLNRITLDELQRCLLVAGLVPTRVQLISENVRIPEELHRYPLSELMTSGVKLLARSVGQGGLVPRHARYAGLMDVEDHEAFVRAAYSTILQREPDPAGLTEWLRRLDDGESERRDVLIAMATGEEAVVHGNADPDIAQRV